VALSYKLYLKTGWNACLDTQIRELALQTHRSFIVQAPAGSGKTTLLTKRFLKLLAQVEQVPEECLALTFTHKAADEMRNRILVALEEAQTVAPPQESDRYQTWCLAKAVLERDTQASWELLHNPARLKIQTIDALSASIARQMPVVSQFGATVNVTEDPSALYQKAARNLILSLESDQEVRKPLAHVLKHLDNNLELTERLLTEMLGFREQWLPYVGQVLHKKTFRAQLERGLQAAVQDTLFNLVQQIPKGFEEVLILAKFAAMQLQSLDQEISDCNQSNLSTSAILQCKQLSSAWPGAKLEDLPIWKGIAELLLTEHHTFRKTLTHKQGFKALGQIREKTDKQFHQTMKQKMLEYLAQLESYPAFRNGLKALKTCPPTTYSDVEWSIIESITGLLPTLVAHLMVLFQETGEVDFAEIALSARRAMGASDCPTDLALEWDYKIKHILVDEFQDTSVPQLKLLEQLTAGWAPDDGRTLFLVGDPQQSIYRFRQAEVGLFLQTWHQGLGGIPLIPLTLSANFRSDPKVVSWINKTFSDVFPKENDVIRGAVTFSPSISALHSTPNVEVEVRAVTLDTEAEQLSALIQSARLKDPQGTIAILVRSRRHLKNIIPYLKEAGIAYRGVEIERLDHHPLIRDLMTLTRALLHLGDRIAWLALLRSPWCGLTLQDLWVIANEEPRLPIWFALKKFEKTMKLRENGTFSHLALERLPRFIAIMEKALYERDRYPIAHWVRAVWKAFSEFGNALEDHYAPIADQFFSRLEAQKYSTTEEDFALFKKKIAILYATAEVMDPQAVQVMTIHKAKGLEFDTVIVAGLDRRQKSRSNPLLLWESPASYQQSPYLILAAIPALDQTVNQKTVCSIYNYLKAEGQQRDHFEEMRLLYVASTRAKKRLYWLSHKAPVQNP